MSRHNGLTGPTPEGFDPPTPRPFANGSRPVPFSPTPKAAVLGRRLAVVVCLGQPLPIVRIPKQPHVAAMRNDVVDNFSRIDHALVRLKIIDRNRMNAEISRTRLLPSRSIASLRRRTANIATSALCLASIAIRLRSEPAAFPTWMLRRNRHYGFGASLI